MSEYRGARIHINGVVQGVGFRPFVYGLAARLELTGWVRNTSAGVDIEVDGTQTALEQFVDKLRHEAPPLAHIETITSESCPPQGFTDFEIVHSQPVPDAFQPIAPDVSVCLDCLRELQDPKNHRYLYPFINCTNCGPRFTIIEDIPYDRPNTTMAAFPMCPKCAAEYNDPLDRRFHAQPVACPACGPHVWLETSHQIPGDENAGHARNNPASAIYKAQKLFAQGKIIAIKGLGGFHLACDALNAEAVSELRRRKLRVDKPFALMMPDIQTIEKYCFVDSAERQLLVSKERPVVILRRRPAAEITAEITTEITTEVAPGQDTLGVMLPYTPLHFLLFHNDPSNTASQPSSVLVMTSGNLSEEPIAIANDEARDRLGDLSDYFLMHNRPIGIRCDDAVMRVFHVPEPVAGRQQDEDDLLSPTQPLRRSRGYAPFPVHLPYNVPPLLATGAELKNTFCLTREHYVFMSHHIGDLENFETLQSFEAGIDHFEHLFRVQPQALAYDLHPDYLATRYALERASKDNLPAFGVQHHHAHIAACMAENGLQKGSRVIGISFDGIGYGPDGAIWGGEFLLVDYHAYQRPFHLAYTPLPGGDKATREPWRLALSWLRQAGLAWAEGLPPVNYVIENVENADRQLEVVSQQIQTGLNAPQTSSIGRLFDAAAALAGVRQIVNYEAQAAIEFEALADSSESGVYHFDIHSSGLVDPIPVIHAITTDQQNGVPIPIISARFHNSLAQMILRVCNLLRENTAIDQVALSGGVWQNVTLLRKTMILLQHGNFTTYIHRQVPANDGGLSLGQAIIAANNMAANNIG